MIEFLRRIFGKSTDNRMPSPQGKTGDQWEEDDFAGRETPLAIDGGAEFVKFCIQQGTCELDGKVLEKFKEIIRKYPIPEEEDDDEDYDATEHFAVVVRQGLIDAGLIPAGDPDRYQYKISMGFIHYAD